MPSSSSTRSNQPHFAHVYSHSRIVRLLKLTALVQIWLYKRAVGGFEKKGANKLGQYLDELGSIISEIQTAREEHARKTTREIPAVTGNTSRRPAQVVSTAVWSPGDIDDNSKEMLRKLPTVDTR